MLYTYLVCTFLSIFSVPLLAFDYPLSLTTLSIKMQFWAQINRLKNATHTHWHKTQQTEGIKKDFQTKFENNDWKVITHDLPEDNTSDDLRHATLLPTCQRIMLLATCWWSVIFLVWAWYVADKSSHVRDLGIARWVSGSIGVVLCVGVVCCVCGIPLWSCGGFRSPQVHHIHREVSLLGRQV